MALWTNEERERDITETRSHVAVKIANEKSKEIPIILVPILNFLPGANECFFKR